MQMVSPIRDEKKISQIKNQLKWSWKIRDLLLFELGINSALRISDLLKVKVKYLFDEYWNSNDYFEIKEHKTDKKARITITPKVKETLKQYKVFYPLILENSEHFIFFHQKVFPLWTKWIERGIARRMIDERCSSVGLKWNYGGHTLRKTRGYQARQAWVPIELIQHKLNHSNIAVTKRYLWITDDELEEICNKLDL